MATWTLLKYRNAIRSALNETTTTVLSDTELTAATNDGYKDVCEKALCYEKRITKDNVSAAEKLISLVGNSVIKVNYLEYYTSPKGILREMPTVIGHVPISGSTPQYWFQWGEFLYIEPVPDVATYDLYVYASCYPDTVLSASGDIPSYVPEEFHEDILDFALSFCCLKLKRWGDATYYYNRYVEKIQEKRMEYISKTVDPRSLREIPDNVTAVAKNG